MPIVFEPLEVGEGTGSTVNSASELPFSPTGVITATDTQSAIAQLVALKQPLSPALTALATSSDSNPFTDAEKEKLAALITGMVDGGGASTVYSETIDGGQANSIF